MMIRGSGGSGGRGRGRGTGSGSGSGSGSGRDDTWKKIRDAVMRPFSCFIATSTLEAASSPADMPPPRPPQDEQPISARGTGQGTGQGNQPSAWDPTAASRDQSLPLVPTWDPPMHRRTESESTNRARECMVCLEEMKTGDAETGDVLYTGACGHAFHFLCVVDLVVRTRHIDCPVCRKQWKVIPALPPKERKELALQALQEQMGSSTPRQRRITIRSPPTIRSPSTNRAAQGASMQPPLESFNDDEIVGQNIPDDVHDEIVELESTSTDIPDDLDGPRSVRINTHTQMSAVPGSSAINTFAVVLHLKAPGLVSNRKTSRAPIDLVAVLDISGTMVGSKISLLKQAMQFVIEKLGKNDRLSVVSFASEAQRLFPLLRMTDDGQHQALRAVNALAANGGTNIAEGLRIGAKVMEDRRESNHVAYILLFSDGRDTHTLNNSGFNETQEELDYKELLPSSIISEGNSGFKIPVHTFGFGADHDASALHMISEVSGGTFSFIENQAVIEVAFAQCIGGLLSVVARDLYVRLECLDPGVRVGSMETGNYPNHIFSNQRAGAITVGNMYADEVRDFLVSVNVPETLSNETNLLRVGCVYIDPLTNTEQIVEAPQVRIERTEVARQEGVSIEVDRQQNRIRAAEAMAQARTAAEDGELENAASMLENARNALLETASARSQDQLCIALAAELKKLQEKMANRPVYERSGRALILSGLSSHSWQRATARGDLIESPTRLFWTYQTSSQGIGSSTQR